MKYQKNKLGYRMMIHPIFKIMGKPKIIAVLGQTATGKSALAVEIAKKINGEIISADSRQIYKGLNIGTGKITKKEMGGVMHYCLSYASPKTNQTVAQYKKKAEKIINKIIKDKKVPIICGGTGLYMDALLNNLNFPEVKPNKKLRTKLEKVDIKELFIKLKKIDPRRARTLKENGGDKNKRRLIRALEILDKTKEPIAYFENNAAIPANSIYDTLYIGIKKNDQELKKMINGRLIKRMNNGLVNEVRNLHAKNKLSWRRLKEFGLEYKYISLYLENTLSREESIEKLKKEIWRYAKRQKTWFKKNKNIHWIENKKEAFSLAKKFLLNRTYN